MIPNVAAYGQASIDGAGQILAQEEADEGKCDGAGTGEEARRAKAKVKQKDVYNTIA